ncbi:hypothetical protein, partial [Streptomyces sp. NPDC057199]|uniref:hypothetical protein n=1 Tax=Streptomyces sp. NPDC057199 TaxID=3346047 RepID=UPI00362F1F1B
MRTPPPTSDSPHSALPPPDPHVVALARQCLEEIDSLVDEWAEYVGPVRASYSDMVSQQEFRDSAWQAFELLLRTVARLPVPEHVAGVSGRVGEPRARQGVPLDALMQAARVDFRVVRAALVRRAGDEGRAQLVTSAHYVWEAVEHHVTGIMTAYQRTVLEMGRRTEDERRLWFSRLLDSGGRNPTVVQDAARALGFQASGHFLCAVAPGGGEASLRGVANALRVLGAPLQQAVASDTVLVVQLGPRLTREAVLAQLEGTPCGVSSVVAGLTEVPRAVTLATATARVLPGDATQPQRLEDSWLDVLVHRAGDLGRDLAADVLGRLHTGVPPAEADRLLETVQVPLSGSGSIADTAAAATPGARRTRPWSSWPSARTASDRCKDTRPSARSGFRG